MNRTTLIIATPDERYAHFEQGLKKQCDQHLENEVRFIYLRTLNLTYCTGCWDCWLKTPGICSIQDDMSMILSEIMQSDNVIFLSPISMDFIPALLKKTCDRMIPLIHPYIEVYKKELHHKNRYPSYPKLGLIIIDPEKNSTRFETIRAIFKRLSINMKTELSPAAMISPDHEECHNAIFIN